MSSSTNDDRKAAVYEAAIWVLFFALLVPAGLVGYVIGRDAQPVARPGQHASAPTGNVSGRAATRPY